MRLIYCVKQKGAQYHGSEKKRPYGLCYRHLCCLISADVRFQGVLESITVIETTAWTSPEIRQLPGDGNGGETSQGWAVALRVVSLAGVASTTTTEIGQKKLYDQTTMVLRQNYGTYSEAGRSNG